MIEYGYFIASSRVPIASSDWERRFTRQRKARRFDSAQAVQETPIVRP